MVVKKHHDEPKHEPQPDTGSEHRRPPSPPSAPSPPVAAKEPEPDLSHMSESARETLSAEQKAGREAVANATKKAGEAT